MSNWQNHVSINVGHGTTHICDPTNVTGGGTVVAGSAFTPTAGRFLLVVAAGHAGLTPNPPTGWTVPTNGAITSGTRLYAWYLASAAGSDTFTVSASGSDAIIFDIYEFPSGTTFVKAANGTGYTSGQAGPSVSSLTGTNWILTVAIIDPGASSVTDITWAAGTRTVFAYTPQSGSDGFGYSAAEFNNDTSTSKNNTPTLTTTSGNAINQMALALLPAAASLDPIVLTAHRTSGTSDSLSWTDSGDAPDGFTILRASGDQTTTLDGAGKSPGDSGYDPSTIAGTSTVATGLTSSPYTDTITTGDYTYWIVRTGA